MADRERKKIAEEEEDPWETVALLLQAHSIKTRFWKQLEIIGSLFAASTAVR
jgi:hypothetical protein